MYQTNDLRTSLVELIADYAKDHDTSVGFIVAELDHVRAITPEITEGTEIAESEEAAPAGDETPACRLGRLFRTACDRGLRQTRAMDCAARSLVMWDDRPSNASPTLVEQMNRCADAIELLLAKHVS